MRVKELEHHYRDQSIVMESLNEAIHVQLNCCALVHHHACTIDFYVFLMERSPAKWVDFHLKILNNPQREVGEVE